MSLHQNVLVNTLDQAYASVTDSAGVGITSTLNGAKQSLDVNLANTGNISVSVANAPSVKIQDGGGTSLTSTLNGAKQSLDVNVANAISTSIPAAASSAVTSVASSAASVSLLASNAGRKAFTIYNDSSKKVYVKFGATASATSFTVIIQPDGFYESGSVTYTGAIDAIWSSAAGFARITELS